MIAVPSLDYSPTAQRAILMQVRLPFPLYNAMKQSALCLGFLCPPAGSRPWLGSRSRHDKLFAVINQGGKYVSSMIPTGQGRVVILILLSKQDIRCDCK
jgi:hypothetical protein